MTGSPAAGASSVDDVLAQVCDLIAPVLGAYMDEFYRALDQRPGPHEIMQRLSEVEQAALKARQCEHVLELLQPGSDPEALAAASRRVGRVHAMVGVEIDTYVQAMADHQRGIATLLQGHRDQLDVAAVQALVGERLMGQLHAAMRGYRDIDQGESAVMIQLTEEVGAAGTVADLSRSVLDGLARLTGVTACFLARLDSDDALQFEMGAGTDVEAFLDEFADMDPPIITIDSNDVTGQGPSGRAWRSGEIVRSDSYMTDPTTVPWRPVGERFGFRSSVAIPLCDKKGAPRALLSLYSCWPGYFAYETRQAMLWQVKRLFERKLVELEDRPALSSGVSAHTERSVHLALLDAGRVEMRFQPIIELPSGRVDKLEALARLRGDDRLITPDEFLPSFGNEELLRLFELGLQASLAALLEWDRAGCATNVSVNLPVSALHDVRYLNATATALRDFRVDPARLTLELLETGHVDREVLAHRLEVDELKALGVRLAQDDLGSGYSSLLRLRHFAFDEVKIDRALVGASAGTRSSLHFIEPITEIAHSLGLTVVAEGLETIGLIEAAIELGVDGGQGFAIARPMAGADVPSWVRDFRLGAVPGRPTTPLGALASHIAWERRVAALRDDPACAALAELDRCPMTAFVGTSEVAVARAHEELHHGALHQRGGGRYRLAWDDLIALIDVR